MPKGYWVAVYHSIDDAEKFAAYIELASPAIAKGGGKFIARGVASQVYEHGILERTTIIEFESVQAAIDTHDSPEYQESLVALDGAITRDLRIVAGVE